MQGHTQTEPQVKKLAPLTTWSSSSRCVSAAEHHSAEHNSKTGRTKLLKQLLKRDLETIIVLVLLAFNFIPQMSHHSLTFTRSLLRDSATLTLTAGDGTTAIKVESSASPIAYSPEWKKAPRCIGGTIMGPKHCPAALLTRH